MEQAAQGLGIILASYISGAVPFGYLIVRLIYKQDIRRLGSGNPGATNVWRCFGKGPGLATLAFDVLKGFAPVFLARRLFAGSDVWPLLSGMAAILGHNWSLFLRGRGGKGVATSAGVFLVLMPRECAVAIGAFLLILVISKRVSISSIGAAVVLVISSLFLQKSISLQAVAFAAGLMILVKHISNLRRILKGEEPKVKIR